MRHRHVNSAPLQSVFKHLSVLMDQSCGSYPRRMSSFCAMLKTVPSIPTSAAQARKRERAASTESLSRRQSRGGRRFMNDF